MQNAINILTVIVLSVLAISCGEQTINKNTQRPNIIYIYADDLGYAEIEPYGQAKIKTPNLAKLGEEGIKFTQHYSGAPVCAPARCMLLTGKHAGRSYIRGNYELGGFADSLEAGQMPLHEGAFTIPKMLKKVGYTTGMVGKWGLGMHNNTGSPLKQGFDFYCGILDQKQAHNFYSTHLWLNDELLTLNNQPLDVHRPLNRNEATDDDFDSYLGNEYVGDVLTKHALGFIEQNKNDPFFLYLPFPHPHVSLQAPKEYIDQYIDVFNESESYYGEKGYTPAKYPLATYAAMITYLDDQVGKIMAKIKELGLDENTIIMFSSDNGTTFNGGVQPAFFNSVAGLRGLKMDVFEGGIRVPFLARWLGKIKPGTTSDHASAQYDVMATLADITGQTIDETNGISFLESLLGNDVKQRKHPYMYWEYPERGGQVAVRKGKWKGVKVDIRERSYQGAPWMLFDLESDLYETKDVATAFPEVIQELNDIVKKEHQPSHIREWEIISPKF